MSAFLINPCKFLVGKVVNSDTIPVGRSSKSYRWRLPGRAGSVSILTGWLFQDRGKISFRVSFSRIYRKEYCWKNYYSSIVNACYLRVNCKGRNHGWDDNRRSLFKICINMWTVSSDVSIQAPLAAALSPLTSLLYPPNPWCDWCVKVDHTTGYSWHKATSFTDQR